MTSNHVGTLYAAGQLRLRPRLRDHRARRALGPSGLGRRVRLGRRLRHQILGRSRREAGRRLHDAAAAGDRHRHHRPLRALLYGSIEVPGAEARHDEADRGRQGEVGYRRSSRTSVNAVSAAVEPLPPAVDDVLQRYWGFETLRPLQGSAIRAVLERRDSVVVLPTGGGKSLCFQVPAAHRRRAGHHARRLAADRADEGPGRRPGRQRRAGGAPRQHACRRDARQATVQRPPRRALQAALRLARAADGRRRRQLPGDGGAGAASATSPSTRRTASATGATTSARSTGSSARCARALPQAVDARLHRHGDDARARGHRRAARAARRRSCWSAASTGPNLIYRVRPRLDRASSSSTR